MKRLALAWLVLVGCGKPHEQLASHAKLFCHSLATSIALARDNAAAGRDPVTSVPYGQLRGELLGTWYWELTFCAGIRPDAKADGLAQRFNMAADQADRLMSGGNPPPPGSPERAKLVERLTELGAIAQAVDALPLRDD